MKSCFCWTKRKQYKNAYKRFAQLLLTFQQSFFYRINRTSKYLISMRKSPGSRWCRIARGINFIFQQEQQKPYDIFPSTRVENDWSKPQKLSFIKIFCTLTVTNWKHINRVSFCFSQFQTINATLQCEIWISFTIFLESLLKLKCNHLGHLWLTSSRKIRKKDIQKNIALKNPGIINLSALPVEGTKREICSRMSICKQKAIIRHPDGKTPGSFRENEFQHPSKSLLTALFILFSQSRFDAKQ